MSLDGWLVTKYTKDDRDVAAGATESDSDGFPSK